MVAVGCLLLVILPLLGLTLGGLLGGQQAALWSAAVGFAIALLVCGAAGYALLRARRR